MNWAQELALWLVFGFVSVDALNSVERWWSKALVAALYLVIGIGMLVS